MSYCRWSSMNWRCDVYVYEHCAGGWTTHVAGRRRIFPPIPDLPLHRFPRLGGDYSRELRRVVYPSRWHAAAAHVLFGAWAWWHRLSMWTVRIIPLRPIGLPFDGETFSDDTAADCADRLEWLRGLGYIVPQYAIDALRSEVDDGVTA